VTTQRVAFVVGPEAVGQRLDAYLARRLRGLSRTQIQEIIAGSLVGPEGRRLKPSTLVTNGLRFTIAREAAPEPPLPEIPVLAQDDHLVVLDKPAGVPVHPAGKYRDYTVTGFLGGRYPARPDPAHRLDRETSGLLVCGKGPTATASLKRAFARGEVEKRYLAIVEGWPLQRRFTVDLPLELGRGPVRLRMQVGQGKPARTDFRVLGLYATPRDDRFALVAALPRTGRQHQIRAHLQAAGFPVVGDKLYGFDERIFLRFIEGALSSEDQRLLRLPRHALHARRLTLTHPADGTRRSWRSPLPVDLRGFLRGLTRHPFPR
jgi:23S rRNA pseudouridine1911/1915/1917 synthase